MAFVSLWQSKEKKHRIPKKTEPDRMPGTLADYARGAGISENYLSRLVKQSTGRSVGG